MNGASTNTAQVSSEEEEEEEGGSPPPPTRRAVMKKKETPETSLRRRELNLPVDKIGTARSTSIHMQAYLYKKGVERDISANLDHIVALGNDIILAAHRRNAWVGTSIPAQKSRKSGSSGGRSKSRTIHAEDRVLYSRLRSVIYMNEDATFNRTAETATPFFQWPIDFAKYSSMEQKRVEVENGQETKPISSDVDKEWEHFYGDGIDSQKFLQRRSRKRPRAETVEAHSGTCGRAPGSMMELQGFIQRAWDKAVHIASNTIEINPTATTVSTTSSNSDEDEGSTLGDGIRHASDQISTKEHGGIPDRPRLGQAKAVLRCKNLGIQFQPVCISDNDPYYSCQSCNKRIRYVSRDKVMEHLFGSRDTRACCENLIQEKEKEIVQGIIEKETMHILDNLLHIVFKKAKEHNAQKDKRTRSNWLDVCKSITDALDDPTNACMGNKDDGESKDDVKTFQFSPDILPFPLSKDLVKVALSRLIERYSDNSQPVVVHKGYEQRST